MNSISVISISITLLITFVQSEVNTDHFLTIHNKARSELGVPVLTWSANLASRAQAAIELCPVTHKLEDDFENLAWGWPTLDSAGAAQKFYDEKADYDAASRTCPSGRNCGHFAAMVKAELTQIGCGFKQCSGIFGQPTVSSYSCYYANSNDPAGSGASPSSNSTTPSSVGNSPLTTSSPGAIARPSTPSTPPTTGNGNQPMTLSPTASGSSNPTTPASLTPSQELQTAPSNPAIAGNPTSSPGTQAGPSNPNGTGQSPSPVNSSIASPQLNPLTAARSTRKELNLPSNISPNTPKESMRLVASSVDQESLIDCPPENAADNKFVVIVSK